MAQRLVAEEAGAGDGGDPDVADQVAGERDVVGRAEGVDLTCPRILVQGL